MTTPAALATADALPTDEGHQALHLWFGLSYANYLTMPRSFLQSMPDEWQGKLAAILQEADEAACKHKVSWPPEGYKVHVELRQEDDDSEPAISDPLADYQRGRRRLWSAPPAESPAQRPAAGAAETIPLLKGPNE